MNYKPTNMKKYLLKNTIIALCLVVILAILVTMCTQLQKQASLKEGDIVFQISQSQQSKYIMTATMSPWGHCGIIIEKPDGLYVLEAVEPVKLTDYETWKKHGRFGIVSTKRYTDSALKVNYKPYLGLHYDSQFKFNNGKWYCSELIYDIYLKQYNVELCEPRKVEDYMIGKLAPIMKRRGINKKQLVVAPSDLYNSEQLK